MFASLGAMLRVSLRRSLADWPIVLAAGLIVTISATLLAAGTMYTSAVSVASLHRVLADAPVTEANIQVSVRLPPDRIDPTDATVTAELRSGLGEIAGTVVRTGRSDSFALPSPEPGGRTALAAVGFLEDLERQATLRAGAWPTDIGAETSVVPVAVSEAVASSLGLEVGRVIELHGRADATFVVRVRVAAIFTIDDRTAAAWWEDEQVLEGMLTSERFVTYGPLFTTRANLLNRATAGQLSFAWRAMPAFDGLDPDGIDRVRARVEQLRGGMSATLGSDAGTAVATGLPELLARTQRSLLVSRTGVLVLVIQLTALAAYAVLLSAGLLVEHRRAGTALLRSRGAGRSRLTQMALIEGIVLAGLAALVAPWLAAAALGVFDRAGPLADIGLRIQAAVNPAAYVAAGVAAALCLVALVLPTFLAGRSIAATHGGLSRAETRDIGRRLGLDVALLAVTAVGLIQLRTYGAPLTTTVRGTIGLDPLLVATPAIGLVAGAVVALRLVPLAATLIDRGTERGRGLVASLGSRQLARRPLRYTRAALLLMLAVAMGVFSVSYVATWTGSQLDQANHEVGADLVVLPGHQGGAAPAWTLDRAYAAIPGVLARTQVVREPIALGAAARDATILGLDASSAAQVVRLRADLSGAPIDDLMSRLAAGRPASHFVRLPGERREPGSLRLSVSVDVRTLTHQDGTPSDLAPLEGWRGLSAFVVIRDATGALYRFAAVGAGAGGRIGALEQLVVPLGAPGAPEGSSAFAYPIELVAIELAVDVPPDFLATEASLTIHGVDAAVTGSWQPVPLREDGGWRARATYYRQAQRPVDVRVEGGAVSVSTGGQGLPVLPPLDDAGRGTVVTFAPASLSDVAAGPIPAVVTDEVLAATGRSVGDELALALGGARRELLLVNAVRGFPATEAGSAQVIVDLPTLALLRFEGNGAVVPAEEWWLSVRDGERESIVATLGRPPILSTAVLDRAALARTLATDPVALGIIGALAIGFAAAALFAVVGFIVSTTVAARERLTEFALLRALGLSGGQLRAWLSLESAVLAVISLAAGTVLGLAMAWVALPFVTVTQRAAVPFPPVLVRVPWDAVAALEVIGVVALGASVMIVARLMRGSGITSLLRAGEE